jgi:alanyl-tRNA synthetase
LTNKELGTAFPELREKNAAVIAIVAEEEQAFSSLLERGVKYFEEVSSKMLPPNIIQVI